MLALSTSLDQLGAQQQTSPKAACCAYTVRCFARDRSGNVAMLFGLFVIPLVAMMGLASISGTSTRSRRTRRAALDAAALAAGRAAQLSPSNAVTAASAAATAYFNQAKPKDVVSQHAAVLAELQQHRVHGHGDLVGEDAIPERALLDRS